MPGTLHPLDRPIRVVVFGSGPQLNREVERFLCRLEAHPEIELLGAICQAESQGMGAVFKDLWRRRGMLAFPLFFYRLYQAGARFIVQPRRELALRKALARLRDRLWFVPDIHTEQVLQQVRRLKPDLGLIYGSPILRPKLYEIPRFGTLGIHHGKLPQYRGNKTTFWALYNGDAIAGVTIQHVNSGLDTGSLVKEGCVETAGRSYQRVVRELEALGLDLYMQAILEVKGGTATFRPQTGSLGKLYRNPSAAQFVAFWARQVGRHWRAARSKSVRRQA